MDDDALIAAVAGGDDTALRELFARHAPWLAARLRTVLPAAEVEDVLQETFLAVWRGAAGYRPDRARSAAGSGVSPGGRPRCGCAAAARPSCCCPLSTSLTAARRPRPVRELAIRPTRRYAGPSWPTR